MEEYVKNMILQNGYSVKSFSEEIGIPYTTLVSILNRGFAGASLSNVEKICEGLSITVNDLLSVGSNSGKEVFAISDKEKTIIIKYREKKEMQAAVDALLGLNDNK